MRRYMVTSMPRRAAVRTLAAAAAAVAVGFLAGCAVLSGTPRLGAINDGHGELMNLDAPVGQTSVVCPAHRKNGGAHVGYSSYAVAGSRAQVRSELCPLAPLPSDNRWVYTQRTRPDQQSAVELWASITSDLEPGTRPQWQRAVPTLSFVCALTPAEQSMRARMDWVIPPHPFEGAWDSSYTLAWQTPASRQYARWEASPIETEAVWMLEPAPETMLQTLMGAPASGRGQDATVTFDVTDGTGTYLATFDLNGWEHALSPLSTDCRGPAG